MRVHISLRDAPLKLKMVELSGFKTLGLLINSNINLTLTKKEMTIKLQ